MYLLFLKTVTRVMIINKMRHTSPKLQKSHFDRFRRCTVGWLQPYSVTTRKHTYDSVRLRATSISSRARPPIFFSFLLISFVLLPSFLRGCGFFLADLQQMGEGCPNQHSFLRLRRWISCEIFDAITVGML